MSLDNATNDNATNATLEKKSTGIAALLSILITGAGHLYAGKDGKGTFLFVVYIFLTFTSIATLGIGLVLLIPFWIWGIVDAMGAVEEYNDRIIKGKRETDQKQQAESEEKAKSTIVSSEFVTQLEKISKLHIANFLTDEEYQSRKKDLILSLVEKNPDSSAEDFFAALIPSVEKGYLTKEEVSQIKAFLL